MRTVQNMLDAALKIDIPYQVQLSLIDGKQDYIRLQQEQLSRGQRSDGKLIFNVKTGSDQYSAGYAKKKGKSSPIDLHDKGDFYGGINIFIENPDEAIVGSEDEKNALLQENYGDEILGLNDDSKVKLKPIVEEFLIKGIEKELNRR